MDHGYHDPFCVLGQSSLPVKRTIFFKFLKTDLKIVLKNSGRSGPEMGKLQETASFRLILDGW